MEENNNDMEKEVTTTEETTEQVVEETTAVETEVVATEEDTPSGDPDLANGNDPKFKWFIAKALTGQENKVAKTLKERVVNYKKTEFFSDIIVPEETVVSNAGGKKRTRKQKFFPGYIFVKMIMNQDTWHLVKNTDKITGFVGGTPTNPQPISDDEVARMFNQAEEGYKKPRANVDFAEGDSVKVTEGPFASFVGTVEAVSEKGKLKVNVSIFGRPTPVELDYSQVEKV